MTDADLIALRDKAAHKLHVAQAALAAGVEALTALDAAVVERLIAGGAVVTPLEGGGNKPPA
jgi:hypothetical protein